MEAVSGWGRAAAGLTMAAVMVSGCATMGSGPGGEMTELDKAGGRCLAAVGIGILAGAIIGNNVGDGNARRGGAVGGAAGLAACFVIREAAKERDAILAYQREAAQQNMAATNNWVAASGKRMVMTVEVDEDDVQRVSADTTPQPLCRYSRSSVSVEGMGAADLGRQRWCRGTDGNWVAA